MASNPQFFLSVFILCFFLFCVFCVSFSSFFCSATTTYTITATTTTTTTMYKWIYKRLNWVRNQKDVKKFPQFFLSVFILCLSFSPFFVLLLPLILLLLLLLLPLQCINGYIRVKLG